MRQGSEMGYLLNFFIFTSLYFEVLALVEPYFCSHGLIPDIVSVAPRNYLKVYFPSGYEAKLGNELPVNALKCAPAPSWSANPRSLYTLILAGISRSFLIRFFGTGKYDPDAPSRSCPKERAFLHWMVTNIPGSNLAAGNTVFEYKPPGPPSGTGVHRYVFLVYQQASRICYNGPTNMENRGHFSPDNFAYQYNLGCPFAGNFFLTRYAP